MKLFTSESVSAGHPDKMADLISDSILDAYLAKDPDARVACETLLSAKGITLAGEITSSATVNHEDLARSVIRGIDADYEKQAVFNDYVVEQSPNIAAGVDSGGAGDQGLMFGYSTSETPERMPLPIALSHRIINQLNIVNIPYLKSDAKAQVTVDYSNPTPTVHTVVISVRHNEGISQNRIHSDIEADVLTPSIGEFVTEDTTVHINPAGDFVLGGPLADAGLTGRKIIVDTYGGYARHGGGAFSGKDATKVDRSGAYMARYIANHIVGAGIADKCEVQMAYAIGVADPVSISVDTQGTGKVEEGIIAQAIGETFDMSPRGIIEELELGRPVFADTATGGHFGRKSFTWENTPHIDVLKAIIERIKFERGVS